MHIIIRNIKFYLIIRYIYINHIKILTDVHNTKYKNAFASKYFLLYILIRISNYYTNFFTKNSNYNCLEFINDAWHFYLYYFFFVYLTKLRILFSPGELNELLDCVIIPAIYYRNDDYYKTSSQLKLFSIF